MGASSKTLAAHVKWRSFAFHKKASRKNRRAVEPMKLPAVTEDSLCTTKCHWVSLDDIAEHGEASRKLRERELDAHGFTEGDGGWYRRCPSCAAFALDLQDLIASRSSR